MRMRQNALHHCTLVINRVGSVAEIIVIKQMEICNGRDGECRFQARHTSGEGRGAGRGRGEEEGQESCYPRHTHTHTLVTDTLWRRKETSINTDTIP